MNWQQLLSTAGQLGEGLLTTLSIFLLTLIFALPLGLLVAKGRMSKSIIIRTVVRIYISVMRGTPLMLQLFVVYFGPYYIFKIPLRELGFLGFDYREIAVVIGFVINYAAYFAEIYRGGIQSMPLGQYEAAQVLGFTKGQTFFRIILPQVIKRVLPSITNEVITLVKDTSLAFVIAVTEMFTVAKSLASAQSSVIPFVAAGLFYYIMNGVVELIMNHLEKRFDYYN